MQFRRKFISEMKKLKVQWVQYLLRGTTSTRSSMYCLMQRFSKSHLALFLRWLTISLYSSDPWVSASTAMQRGSECIQAFGCCIEKILCGRQFTRFCCWCFLTKLSGDCSSLTDKMKMIMSTFLRTVTQTLHLTYKVFSRCVIDLSFQHCRYVNKRHVDARFQI